MGMKLAAAGAAIVILALLLQGCFFGGGGSSPASISRPSSIPTATPPANLPEPILLSQAQGAARTTAPGPSGGSGETYTVKSGDTLAGIAAQLGVAGDQQQAWIAEVLRLNGIADARLLSAGQVLQLPRAPGAAVRTTGTPTAGATRTGTPSGPAATATPTQPGPASTSPAGTATPRPAATGGGGTYTVQSGDYPYLIASKLGVPESQQTTWVNQLVALNNIDPNALVVGQVLDLPAGTPSGGAGATSTPEP